MSIAKRIAKFHHVPTKTARKVKPKLVKDVKGRDLAKRMGGQYHGWKETYPNKRQKK